MKFEVSRARWLRGEGMGKSRLLRESDKKMCCLGFRALATGFTKKEILSQALPRSLFDGTKVSDAWKPFFIEGGGCWGGESDICVKIVWTNDDPALSDDVREEYLKRDFAEAGDEIVFVD